MSFNNVSIGDNYDEGHPPPYMVSKVYLTLSVVGAMPWTFVGAGLAVMVK